MQPSHRIHRHGGAIHPPRWMRRTVYACLLLLWASGALWLLLPLSSHDAAAMAGVHPLQPALMKLHGLVVWPTVFLSGALLQAHMQRAWALRRGRGAGGGFALLMLLLAATGWGLYYLGDERLRGAVSVAHWAAGLALPLVFVFHARAAWRRSMLKRRHGPRMTELKMMKQTSSRV
jgi:hypothetical protein